MILQDWSAVYLILGIVIGTIIVTLILFIIVMLLESKTKAKDKIFFIVLIAFLAVFLLPIVMNAIGAALGAIGDLFAAIRNVFDPGEGRNYLVYLVPVFGFLILLVINKYLLDIEWDMATWISLILLFVLYIMFCVVHELSDFFVPNPIG
ncbi:MAG: hypothetical protein JW891_14660 [Candidatus Lokiarchaeota archaeon]|nr:hypothetical protein [Candidatus Lokiarchaeota archaeon]